MILQAGFTFSLVNWLKLHLWEALSEATTISLWALEGFFFSRLDPTVRVHSEKTPPMIAWRIIPVSKWLVAPIYKPI